MKEKIFLPGLTEWRAIAALCVVPQHLELIKKVLLKVPSPDWLPRIDKLGVVFFFSLSGFLITWRLLQEKDKNGFVSLPKFYLRRVLRIWPLYYLIMIGAGTFWYFRVLQYRGGGRLPQSFQEVFFLAIVLPQYTRVGFTMARQVWSLAIEEQFYLIQPLVFKTLNRFWWILLFVFLIAIFFVTQSYGSILVGCSAALMIYRGPKIFPKILTHKVTQYLGLLALIAILFQIKVKGARSVDYRVMSVAFSLVLVNSSFNPSSIFSIRSKVLYYLGERSYGIYMYHPFCILVVCHSLKPIKFIFPNNFSITLAVYLFSISLTFFLSDISYRYYENFFLRQRKGLESFFSHLKRKLLKHHNSKPQGESSLKTP